ncbi:M15 family metallopeptidase [Thalassobacillus pellis]|uniref:M15 family metallopeptidase n=1 Tax=Thalassobacillus pellis TaxID=748008 RepID=UPI00196023F6|nr:M15 family metallopeptidase [Thalassobacillus pellis]MBM7551124.1 D-alanyl-D-alanine carboxypeptidase [Thalassobacillus pellis]
MDRMITSTVLSLTVLLAGCAGFGEETNSSQLTSSDNAEKQSGMKEKEQEDTNHANKNKNETTDDTPVSGKEPNSDKGNSGMVVVEEPNSFQVVVNKNRKLPDGFVPKNLVVPDVPFYFDEFHPKKQMRKEAAKALEELFQGARQAGLELVGASGYRSYERQKSIYQNNVKTRGQEWANQFSAKPGTSEHQTGLAMDVTSAQMAFKLEQSFSQTAEGEWLAKHAYEYGFVIRYPKGKSDITGYSYEPWHLRYVGKETAEEIHQQEKTLEEFFGLLPSKQ